MSYELRHQKVTIHLDMSQGRAPNKVEGILKGRDAEFIKVERFSDKMIAWYPVQHVLCIEPYQEKKKPDVTPTRPKKKKAGEGE